MTEKGTAATSHKYLERTPDGKGGWTYRYLPGATIEITPHEKLGMNPITLNVTAADETHADLNNRSKVPHSALAHFKDDLEGRVRSDKRSGDPDVDAVTSGEAEFLGKGDDGLAFRSGGNVVKVSTVVPYQPLNPAYKTAEKAVEVAREQHETQQALRDAGVPNLLPERFIEHDGRGYTIKRYVEIPEKLTLAQLDAAHDAILVMHKAGYLLGDEPQVGVDEDGKAVLFDVGKAHKAEPYAGYSYLDPKEADLSGLDRLYSANGERYMPKGDNLQRKWDFELKYAMKMPPKADAARDRVAAKLIGMANELRKDGDALDKLVIDDDLQMALQKLERPEPVNVAALLEQTPEALHAELPGAAERAVKVGARAGTLELLGAGAEGMVFTDGARAFKVGRAGSGLRQNEAAALEVLSKDPRTKELVPSFEAYDEGADVIVRDLVEGRPGGWGSKGLWEAHETISKVLREHDFTAPEFKENSFIVEGDKPKLVGVGYVQPIGKRATQALSEKIGKLRAIDFQTDPMLALDLSLALFPTYDEGAMSLDTLRSHVAKIKSLAPERKFSDLQFADRLKEREGAGPLGKSAGSDRPGHKYVKKTPDGKGGWNYEYTKALFHSAPLESLESIQEHGLRPREGAGLFSHGVYGSHSQGKVFLSEHHTAASNWHGKVQDMLESQHDDPKRHRVAMLRVKHRATKTDEVGNQDVEGSRYTTKAIPPEDIEYHDRKLGWRPLSTWEEDTKLSEPKERQAMDVGKEHVRIAEKKAARAKWEAGAKERFEAESKVFLAEREEKQKALNAEWQGKSAEERHAQAQKLHNARRIIASLSRLTPDWQEALGVDKNGELAKAQGTRIISLQDALSKARKLHRRRDFRGLKISVENQTGSIRHWYDAQAKRKGRTVMRNDYGYIRRTKGADGDHVDVYVGPDKMAPYVFVIDQLKAPDFVETDEQKCMLGFPNLGAAVAAYNVHYDDPRFLGQVRAVAFEDFADFVLNPKNHGALVKSYVVQRYSPSQEMPDFEGVYGTAQTEKETKASIKRRKALARRNAGKYGFHGLTPAKPTIRFRVRDWATIRDAKEMGRRVSNA